MNHKLLSTISFCAVLAGCGEIPFHSPAPSPVGAPLPAPVSPPPSRSPAPEAAANAELMFQVLASLGIDYQNGGRSPNTGFDCSGLVAHVYLEAFAVRLPHNTLAQSRTGSPIERIDLAPGDLVFFNTLNRPYSHVGIYLGEGRFVHAPKSGTQVRVERMQSRYWSERYNGARRISQSL